MGLKLYYFFETNLSVKNSKLSIDNTPTKSIIFSCDNFDKSHTIEMEDAMGII